MEQMGSKEEDRFNYQPTAVRERNPQFPPWEDLQRPDLKEWRKSRPRAGDPFCRVKGWKNFWAF